MNNLVAKNHFLSLEDAIAAVEQSEHFDPEWYADVYRDVGMSGLPPALHFVKYGARLGRDPGPRFNTNLYAQRNRLNAGSGKTDNPLIHFEQRFKEAHVSAKPLPVADIKRKLWGGFAKPALELLIAALSSGKYSDNEKADAALTVGRYYALNENWENAVKYIKMISKFNKSRFRHKKTKVLLIECFIQAGDYEAAQKIIDFERGKGIQGDFQCALSNLLYRQDEEDAAVKRVAALNELYAAHGFSQIALEDPAAGLVFGNIRHDEDLKATVEGPKVSVLVPVYNASEFLDVAMKSLLYQTWANLEIIAVEDRGPDDSWEKLQAFAAEDPRLKIFRNDVNRGAYPTRNHALSLATGDFITVHDSDDWSHPQMIEAQMRTLLDTPGAKATCSAMTRVYPNLHFILRPQRENLEHVHRSYPSLLIRREDLELLGEWDSVSANADDELIQRARRLWGPETIVDAEVQVPLSFFLVHENSLTQQAGTSLSSLTFGIRREYSRQASYWRSKLPEETQNIPVKRISLKDPFPIPAGLAPRNWPRDTRYDLVIVSDLSLLGGTRRCNEGYIAAATALGMRVGLFHWPRFDLKLAEVAEEYVALSYQDNVDILVPEDKIQAGLVLIHHPPILGQKIDAVPQIDAKRVAVLVNQLPMQRWSQSAHYYTGWTASATCKALFGHKPEWIAISNRVRTVLEATGGFERIHDEIWSPPYAGALPDTMPAPPEGLGSDRPIVVGRHARSHWTKWPASPKALKAAYCGDLPGIEVRLLGGAEDPQKVFGALPQNWSVLEFDSVDVSSFLRGLDFFVHYVHGDYIEEFGRNVMEAMAMGRVVVLPPDFADIFGDAAVYAPARDVAKTIRAIWADPERYRAQCEKGFRFVHDSSTQPVVQRRLKAIMA